MTVISADASFQLNTSTLNVVQIFQGTIAGTDQHQMIVTFGNGTLETFNGNLSYGASKIPTSGFIDGYQRLSSGTKLVDISNFTMSVDDYLVYAVKKDSNGFIAQILSGDDRVFGGSLGDYVDAGEGNNLSYGNGGNDTIIGGSSKDMIYGNAGDDLLRGFSEFDTVYGGQGNDSVYGGSDNDVIYGNMADDTLFGETGNDKIYGGAGNDRMYGGIGDDTLIGGRGDDTLQGGSGFDRFIFGLNQGQDTITDFSAVAGDRIQLPVGTTWQAGVEGNVLYIALADGSRCWLSGYTNASGVTNDWFVFV